MIALGVALLLSVPLQEERIKDSEYQESYASVVKAYEAAEKAVKNAPADALKAVEEQVLSRLPKLSEVTIVVVFSSGISKGAEKERHAFFPYNLAGRAAMGSDQLEKAIRYFEKSPTSAELLNAAKKLLEEKGKPTASPSASATSTPTKPVVDLAPYVAATDFAGAWDLLTRERARLGEEYAKYADQLRKVATQHQATQTVVVAGGLDRVTEPAFQAEVVEPCLKACARVPADLETDELRWVKALGAWTAKRDPAELDRLARVAMAFGPAFHSLIRIAQESRLTQIEALVEKCATAARAEQPKLLEQLAQAEAAFNELAAVKGYPRLKESLADLKERLPVSDQALDRARGSVEGVAAIRATASELERLWTSDRHAKLGVDDQKDLATYLAVYRCYLLFLDGRRIDEVATDARIVEAFKSAGPLPAGISPKVEAVRKRIR